MGKISGKINFCWVKAHIGIRGNEITDARAKEAATNKDITECFKKVPKSVVKSELEGISVEKWQREWDQTTKGRTTKEYFLGFAERYENLKKITQNFISIVTGHCHIRSYLHKFKII